MRVGTARVVMRDVQGEPWVLMLGGSSGREVKGAEPVAEYPTRDAAVLALLSAQEEPPPVPPPPTLAERRAVLEPLRKTLDELRGDEDALPPWSNLTWTDPGDPVFSVGGVEFRVADPSAHGIGSIARSIALVQGLGRFFDSYVVAEEFMESYHALYLAAHMCVTTLEVYRNPAAWISSQISSNELLIKEARAGTVHLRTVRNAWGELRNLPRYLQRLCDEYRYGEPSPFTSTLDNLCGELRLAAAEVETLLARSTRAFIFGEDPADLGASWTALYTERFRVFKQCVTLIISCLSDSENDAIDTLSRCIQRMPTPGEIRHALATGVGTPI